MIIVDASVLIAHFGRSDAHTNSAFEILDTDDELGVHTMTLAEILVGPAHEGREAFVAAQITNIGVQTLSPSKDEALTLARLRARHNLKLPDCCVLAAALDKGATLATFDVRLARSARDSGLRVVGSA